MCKFRYKKSIVSLLLASAAFLGFSTSALADGGMAILIELQNGQIERYTLAGDKPVVTFNSSHLTITSQKNTFSEETPYKYEDVKQVYFDNVVSKSDDDIETAIEIIEPTAKPSFSFDYDGYTVRISGNKTPGKVDVYSIDGKKVNVEVSKNDMEVSLKMGTLPAGIYIIRTDSRSFKILVGKR